MSTAAQAGRDSDQSVLVPAYPAEDGGGGRDALPSFLKPAHTIINPIALRRGDIVAIGAGFGTTPAAGASTVSIGAYGQLLFPTAQVLRPFWRDRQRRVRFSIDATVENALAFAALVGERAAADHTAPTGPDSCR
ncbi:hypothetical protein [Amycolatopsis sp. MEPSY49]|uniref:hypothetical protein n=1 Tax=Amycolatopsis sp. MEPSY49 TaxID=3151600 RepID=UPI003EF657FB